MKSITNKIAKMFSSGEVDGKEQKDEWEETSTVRKELQEATCRYITDTLSYINTVGEFCENQSKWLLWRETELEMMKDIKKRADGINLNLGHISQSKNKGRALSEYISSKVSSADNQLASLEDELADILKDTVDGLAKLESFLDALEKLAVTSPHVFTENPVLHLHMGTSPKGVLNIIIDIQHLCPLLLEFKGNAQKFFKPKLQNVEVLSYYLDEHIQTIKKICTMLEKSAFCDFNLGKLTEPLVKVCSESPENEIRRMTDHICQLDEIRKNLPFRVVFLFRKESCNQFMNEFTLRQPQIMQYIQDLEEVAAQLDRMSKGAKISSVAGSSVGAIGGVLSIIGLALIPVTAGVSLALTMTGVGLGITSGVNGIVTTATEIGVNTTQKKKTQEIFHGLMEDVQKLQECLNKVKNQVFSTVEPSKIDIAFGVTKIVRTLGAVGNGIDGLVDAASAAKILRSEELTASVAKVVAEETKSLRNMPRLASDVPDIGQAVAKGPLALTKSARVGFIALNSLFLGMDIFFICKDSISLAKGIETEASQFIRARIALWITKMEAWQKIHKDIIEGLPTSEKSNLLLDTPLWLELDEE